MKQAIVGSLAGCGILFFLMIPNIGGFIVYPIWLVVLLAIGTGICGYFIAKWIRKP